VAGYIYYVVNKFDCRNHKGIKQFRKIFLTKFTKKHHSQNPKPRG
jgi:hypothetical protein